MWVKIVSLFFFWQKGTSLTKRTKGNKADQKRICYGTYQLYQSLTNPTNPQAVWETAPPVLFFIGCWAKPTWIGGVVLLPLKMEVRLVIIFPLRLGVWQWSRHLFNYWKNKKTIIEKEFLILLIWNWNYIWSHENYMVLVLDTI